MVAWYALGLKIDRLPRIGERLKRGLRKAPGYNKDMFMGIGWSFGSGQCKYIKVEKGYSSSIKELIRG